MKEFFKEFFELLGYCVLVICLFFASYLLIANLYHYRELRNVENRDFAAETTYSGIVNKVKDVKTKVNGVSLNNLSSNKVSNATTLLANFNDCISSIEESKFYELANNGVVNVNDIYFVNVEMYNTVNNKCLSGITRNAEILNINSSSYSAIKTEVTNARDRVLSQSDYLISKSLGNSSYFYTTTISRYTIYNDLNSSINLTIANYDDLADALEILADWYVSEFGGEG